MLQFSLLPIVKQPMFKTISDRQKRRIRKRVAKQTVDIELKQKGLKHSPSCIYLASHVFSYKLHKFLLAKYLHNFKSSVFAPQVVYGVKGYSPLHLINSFKVPEFVPVDYMHCVLLGVAKKFAKLWFDSSFHRDEW